MEAQIDTQKIVEVAQLAKKQEESLSKKNNKKRTFDDYIFLLKFYYLPVIVMVIFILIILFGVWPSFRQLEKVLGDLDKQNELFVKQSERLTNLKRLKTEFNLNKKYIQFINKIAPVQETNVAEFQNSIYQIARQDNLVVSEAEGKETIVVSKDEKSILQLLEVPVTFNLEGGFDDLKKFLNDIYKQDDFIIIKEMDFSRIDNIETANWKLKVTLVKYQFIEADNQEYLFNYYLKVPIETKANSAVLIFLNQKYNIDR